MKNQNTKNKFQTNNEYSIRLEFVFCVLEFEPMKSIQKRLTLQNDYSRLHQLLERTGYRTG